MVVVAYVGIGSPHTMDMAVVGGHGRAGISENLVFVFFGHTGVFLIKMYVAVAIGYPFAGISLYLMVMVIDTGSRACIGVYMFRFPLAGGKATLIHICAWPIVHIYPSQKIFKSSNIQYADAMVIVKCCSKDGKYIFASGCHDIIAQRKQKGVNILYGNYVEFV